MIVNDTNRRRRIVTILALVCVVGQVALSPNIALGNGHVNFMLIFAGCVALAAGGTYGVVAGFCAGLFFDLVTTGPIGLMAALLTLAGFGLGLEERNRLTDDTAQAIKLFCATAAGVELLYQLALVLVGQGGGFVETVFLRWVPATVLDCIVFLPFCFILSHLGTQGPRLGKKKTGKTKRGYSTKGLH